MPRFEPFAGLRYDTARLEGSGQGLDEVIAPPYDVIDAAQREELASRSPWNAVRIEVPEPDPASGRDAYRVAGDLLSRWREEGVLRLEERAALYLYRMTFEEASGLRRRTTGVLGALEVSRPGEGDVLPHEQTTPKPKSDRLDLLRASHANTSPVWGLSLAAGLSELCSPAGEAAAAATDDEGVLHELWPLTDLGAIGAIATRVASAPVVIADGHHRYETALVYAEERRAANAGAAGDYDLVMALLVELADEELAVGPIHRLIEGLPDGFDVAGALGRHFELSPAGAGPAGVAAPALVTPSGTWSLSATPETERRAGEDLDSSRLDVALADLPPHELSYHHDPAEVARAVAEGRASAGVLLRPAPVSVIARAARERRRMPAKTTFFTPKPRTGLVFRPVTG